MPFAFRDPCVAAVAVASIALSFTVASPAYAARKTVCTITVNSPDERDIFKRSLPPDGYEFVELVEPGRHDWLASACKRNVRCDALVISGHFDGGAEFYSDRVDARESLPVDELERASCSDSCSGLFGELKEVYLFGCNTLNAEPAYSASPEIARSLLRSGHLPPAADSLTRELEAVHADSNRDRMRRIFHDVPVIYGFSSKAPLGAVAGPMLSRWLQAGGNTEFGTGRPSGKLMTLFAPMSMSVASGMTGSDAGAAYRADLCRMADDASPAARKVAFVHELLARETAETRMFLDVIEKASAALTPEDRAHPDVAKALADIAADRGARDRFLAFARDADQASVRARMIEVAAGLGWLDADARRAELVRMIDDELVHAGISAADVELVCALNKDGAIAREASGLRVPPAHAQQLSHAAMLACLGDGEGRARVVRGLTTARGQEGEIVQVYLRHHPVTDPAELRDIASGLARISDPQAQIRALDTLSRQQLSDRETLETVAGLFPATRSLDVQRAIAGILIRSDDRVLEKPTLVRVLRQHRLKSPDGQDLIDVLIRRWQSAS